MSKLKEPVQGAEKPARDPALSEKRKRAMVQYLAVMFLVAFLLVLLSLFIQNRTLKQSNTDSLTLQGRYESLQTENMELRRQLASQLLEDAQRAHLTHDVAVFTSAMERLVPVADALDSDQKRVYSELQADYTPADDET
jgi:hypothetical protein